MPGSWGKLSMEDYKKILPGDASPQAIQEEAAYAEKWARSLGIWVEKPGHLTIQSSPGPMDQTEDPPQPPTP